VIGATPEFPALLLGSTESSFGLGLVELCGRRLQRNLRPPSSEGDHIVGGQAAPGSDWRSSDALAQYSALHNGFRHFLSARVTFCNISTPFRKADATGPLETAPVACSLHAETNATIERDTNETCTCFRNVRQHALHGRSRRGGVLVA
jgi:hypothetical protein